MSSIGIGTRIFALKVAAVKSAEKYMKGKQDNSFELPVCFSMYDLLLETRR